MAEKKVDEFASTRDFDTVKGAADRADAAAEAANQAALAAESAAQDETTPGGVYIVNGRTVNASGEPVA